MRRDADRRCRQLVAEGWVRVAGGAELASQPELLAALRANGDDLDTYTIFADWLSQHGDRRVLDLRGRLKCGDLRRIETVFAEHLVRVLAVARWQRGLRRRPDGSPHLQHVADLEEHLARAMEGVVR